ncbi:MAG: hypothetical protein QW365_08870 [Candidatus Nezhaarchaeales archaeon]
MSNETPVVITNFYNQDKRTYAVLAKIAPLSAVNYEVLSYYVGGKITIISSKYPVVLTYLSSPQRLFVAKSLRLQSLDPRDYMIRVTVHGEWKKAWWQGYIFSIRTWVIDTGKHVKARGEQAYSLIEEILSHRR